MIIRRRHTANYTTIGNALFEDERLQADELGVLAFLLSKPHEWEVRRPALRRRFNIGRDGMRRILRNIMATGWCHVSKTQLANGTFYFVYEIRDEPGPNMSPEEITKALSAVSAGAVGDDDSDKSDTDHERNPPDPGLCIPVVAGRAAAGRNWPKKDSKKLESENTDSTNGAGFFDQIKAKWPKENMLSEVAAETAYLALSDSQKTVAIDTISAYLDDCLVQKRKMCDLTTYFREKRWQRFEIKPKKTGSVVIKFGSPQFYRWREYKIAIGEDIDRFGKFAKAYGYVAVPSEWPPPLPNVELPRQSFEIAPPTTEFPE
jgi:predicted transcriptional regulator